MTFLHAPRGNLSSHITETTFHLRPPSPCPHSPPHSISPSLEQARYRERAWPLSHAFWEPQRTTTLLKQQTQPLVTSASPSVQRRQSDLLRRLAVGRPARGATRAARPLDRPCRHRHHHPCCFCGVFSTPDAQKQQLRRTNGTGAPDASSTVWGGPNRKNPQNALFLLPDPV